MLAIYQNSKLKLAFRAMSFLSLLLCLLIINGQAQIAEHPVIKDYKGVKIGMTADEVRQKLGEAKSEDKDGFFYVFSDTETAQIMLDGDKKVRVISIDYNGEHQNPPKFEDVFGKNAKPEAKPDGAIYKMVRYPDDGVWVAYSRLAGDKPMISITINKQ
ncbi:MAG TPA: hypothetical protein VK892_09450 [Pyrinomonadaceae bacterium]|nr:hypothetical protein [Pyrinomonadaceae bacterium]